MSREGAAGRPGTRRAGTDVVAALRPLRIPVLGRPGGSARHLWRVPAEGGTPQDVGLVVKSYIEHLTVHPDGLRLTFDAPTINPERSQVWVMENFLPRGKDRK